MQYRFVDDSDLDLLAEWNHQLIRDEGHRNTMTIPELRRRMMGWSPRKRLTVEVLTANEPAVAFWRSVGYVDYSLTLEIMPELTREQGQAPDALSRSGHAEH